MEGFEQIKITMQLTDPSITDLISVSTMTLATTSLEGVPHAAPLYFAADGELHLYFFSDPRSQHIRYVTHHPSAAVTLYPLCSRWEDIRGLQMQGEVQLVNQGLEWAEGWEIYAAKFPFVSKLKDIVDSNTLYVFIPHWVRLVDNRRGFGFKQEWTLT